MLELRTAEADDALRMTEVYIDSWNLGFGHLLGTRDLPGPRVDRMRCDIGDPAVEWTVAEVHGLLVGFVAVGGSRDPVAADLGELDSIAVDPQHWRQGVGRSLMGVAVEQLRASWGRAILWTPADYARGHAFYRATGWHQLGQSRADGTEVAFARTL